MKIYNIRKALAFGVLPLALAAPADTTPPQCGVGGDGNDFYTSSKVSNILECQYLCKSDSKCLSSEFKPSTGACWLYALPVSKAKTKNDASGTWIFNDRNCLASPLVPQCHISGDSSDYYKSSTVNTLADCQSACNSDSKCLSSEYRTSNGGCWLYAGPVSQAKTRNDTSGTYFFYDRNCPIAPQCNIPGDSSDYYKSSTVNTLPDCQSGCKSDSKCLSYEYRPSNGGCWLYTGPVSQAKTRNDTTGTYFFYDRNCSIPMPAPQCNVPGDGSSYYKSTTVNTVGDCQSACTNDLKCLSSEYQPSNGGCWLYDKPVTIAKTRNDTTGTYFFYDRSCPVLPPVVQCKVPGDGSSYYKSLTVKGGVLDCQSACKNDNKCFSSEYRPSNGGCWLYEKPVAIAKTRNDTTGTYFFYDRDCPLPLCGAYRDGSDFYTSSKAGSLQACQSTCFKDAMCLSFEYRTDNGNCWLFAKSAADSSTPTDSTKWVIYDRDCVLSG
ncbi:hypothetical protein GGI35DRAFT_102398 [Trichoderma velutinum]